MNEYDCWFQGGKTAALAEKNINRVCLGENGLVIEQAAAEYRRGMEKMFGIQVNIAANGSPAVGAAVPADAVLLGTIAYLNKTYHLALPAQNAEGFIIRAPETGLIIAGQDPNGALYGVYRFLSLLARGKIKTGAEITDAPVSSLRMINHWDNMDGSIERGYAGLSIFFKNNRIDYDRQRIEDYARLLASVGINRLSINNVNVRGAAKLLITEDYLKDAAELAAIFRPFGIRLLLSINFGAPWSLGKLPTADPLDSAVAAWWKERAALIYKFIPDLAGFLVKADSEGEPGPFQYNRTHADGANMLAEAVKPFGGEIVWRCFVYNCIQDWRDQTVDRARAAYDHFKPLDGAFAANVILQIKFGPYDFQVGEPVAPLFGALTKTRYIMELQITQEYTGHQIDLCYLPWLWADIMNFDTGYGEKSRIKEMIGSSIEGLAAVGSVGLDQNWTGHTLAQANLYGYGRIIWDPNLSAEEIAAEWAALSFGGVAAETVKSLLVKSYPTYEKYNAPFGVCFMVTPHLHYGPSVEGYEFTRWGTYHRADTKAIGIDRTPAGTGYTAQYAPKNAARFADRAACPENQILFFHRLPYDYKMKNGETLLQNIYNTHFEGYDEAAAMLETWKGLKDAVGEEVYQSVLARMERQLENAREWRDQINTYFWRKTAIGDKKGRKIYE